jgi:hypothetical protein
MAPRYPASERVDVLVFSGGWGLVTSDIEPPGKKCLIVNPRQVPNNDRHTQPKVKVESSLSMAEARSKRSKVEEGKEGAEYEPQDSPPPPSRRSENQKSEGSYRKEDHQCPGLAKSPFGQECCSQSHKPSENQGNQCAQANTPEGDLGIEIKRHSQSMCNCCWCDQGNQRKKRTSARANSKKKLHLAIEHDEEGNSPEVPAIVARRPFLAVTHATDRYIAKSSGSIWSRNSRKRSTSPSSSSPPSFISIPTSSSKVVAP